MECKINRDNVLNSIYNNAVTLDDNVIINDGIIKFSNDKSAKEFISNINSNYFGQLKYSYNPNNNSIIIIDTSNVQELYEFSKPIELETALDQDAPTPLSEKTYENTEDIQEELKKLIKFRHKLLENVKNTIFSINAKLKTSLSKTNRNNLIGELQYYTDLANKLHQEISELNDYGLEEIINNIDVCLDTLESLNDKIARSLHSSFADIKPPHNIVEITNNLFKNTELFFSHYATMKDSVKSTVFQIPNELSDELHDKVLKQKTRFQRLKSQFYDDIEAQIRVSLLQNDELLNTEESLAEVLKDPKSIDFKLLFGGAELEDISRIVSLGYNIDSSFSYDGMLGRYAMAKFQKITQDNVNLFEEKKKELRTITQELRKHGINLEDPKTIEWLFETDDYGDRTGKLVSVFSNSFYNKLSSIFKNTKKGDFTKRQSATVDALKDLHDNMDVINVFRLSWIRKPQSEWTQKQALFMSLLQSNDKFNDQLKEMLDNYPQDDAYEQDLRDRLGDENFEYWTDAFLDNVINYVTSCNGNSQSNLENRHKNPLTVLKKVLEAKESYDSVGAIGNKHTYALVSRYDKESGTVKAQKYAIDLATCIYVPKRGSQYYNASYRKNFIEDRTAAGDAKRKLHAFLFDNLKIVNSILDNNASVEFTHLKEEWADEALNAIAGRKLLKAGKTVVEAMKDSFYKETYYSSDNSDVSKNYRNTAKQRYKAYKEVFGFLNEEEMKEYNEKTVKLDRAKYASLDDFKHAVAKARSLEGYNENLYTTLNKAFDLAAAQKSREEMYPIAKTVQRQYESYTTNMNAMDNNKRERANKRFQDWIQRAIQKVNYQNQNNPADSKLSDIEAMDNIMSKIDKVPILRKFIKKGLLKRLNKDEKELYNLYEEIKEKRKLDRDFQFSIIEDGKMVTYACKGGKKFIIDRGGNYNELVDNDQSGNLFDAALKKYFEARMTALGTNLTFKGIVDVLQQLLMVKCLAGVSMSGFNNRIQGMFAASEMDATGYYWTPGNLAAAEKYFFGSPFYRYVNKEGKHFTNKVAPDFTKRMQIMEMISRRMNLFQDMKNQFDRTVEGTQAKANVWKHNMDIWQMSIEMPEFKNQLTMVMSVLMDQQIRDNDGNSHPIFDAATGQFTCYDIVNGELVLKPEFTKYGQQWIDFSTTKDIMRNGVKTTVASDVFQFSVDCRNMIKDTHGDYRNDAVMGWNNSMILSTMMTLKRWFPSEFMRAWSKGGVSTVNTKDGKKTVKSRDLFHNRNVQSGVFYDMVFKSKALWIVPALSLGVKSLSKNPLKSLAGIVAGPVMFGMAMAQRFRATDQQQHDDVTAVMELSNFCKATLYEMATFVPRIFFKKSFNVGTKSFNDAKFLQRYTEVELGNFRSAARQLATRVYVIAIGMVAKTIIASILEGAGDDDDDKFGLISYERIKRIQYWVDNEANTLLQSTERSMHIIDSCKDKFDIDGLPMLRWFDDIKKMCSAISEGDSEDAFKYFQRALPTPRFPVISFSSLASGKSLGESTRSLVESEGEFKKGQYFLDMVPKNIATGGRYGKEKAISNVRKEIRKEYWSLYKKGKLPDDVARKMKKKCTPEERKRFDSLKKEEFEKILNRTTIVPSKTHKPYKNLTVDEFYKKVMNNVKDDPYICNRVSYYHHDGVETGAIFNFFMSSDNDNDD